MATGNLPFPHFNQLAPSTWYYEPLEYPANRTIRQTAQPDLIILSTWMQASPKHILKYINTYQRLYPKSALLVLTNNVVDILFRSRKRHEKHLEAALSAIRGSRNSSARIVLHIFSNGGAHQACQLAKFYREKNSAPLPVKGIALDSAPGRSTYRRTIAALSVGLPSFLPFRILGLLVVHGICIILWCQYHIFHVENVITRMRREINDPSLFPVEAEKLYLYSKADAMIGWRDVEINAKEADAKGWVVKRVRFEKSRHVNHLTEDPERYWAAVQGLVDEM